ncbi:pentatricopeptide repeat-containing protein At5g66500, mitochondrial-like [Typha latifolia]|uniref:pentatricopeptide repeat-containing protein At5g66500, mitochondrial-like n=1 Tax=Typha latifolia TaxID=4733 RepID=UPI003C2DD4A0
MKPRSMRLCHRHNSTSTFSTAHHLLDETPKSSPSSISVLHHFRRLRNLCFDRAAHLDSRVFLPLLASQPSLSSHFHALMLKSSSLSHPIPTTALLGAYSKSGHLHCALSLFDEMPSRDTVTWNALISCLVRHGRNASAISAFQTMVREDVKFTEFTLCSVLKACAASCMLRQGRQIHSWVVANGYNCVVMGTALIDFYSSCGLIQDSFEVFAGLNCLKDVAIYNAMISGCLRNGRLKEAFLMLGKMKPNGITLTSALSACSDTLNLAYGKQVHCAMIRRWHDSETISCNALIDMYAKCGDLKAARVVFDRTGEKNVVSWSSIIDAYGSHGHAHEALELFKIMEEEKSVKVLPNDVTFLAVISACAHSGLVDQGRKCFLLMRDKHGMEPGQEHYACFIDLLGRASRIEEAWDLYCSLSASANKLNSAVCVAMLNVCKFSMDLVRGQQVANHLLELDPDNPGIYILVSNFYAAVGSWAGADELRKVMMDRGLRKEAASSQIAVKC